MQAVVSLREHTGNRCLSPAPAVLSRDAALQEGTLPKTAVLVGFTQHLLPATAISHAMFRFRCFVLLTER